MIAFFPQAMQTFYDNKEQNMFKALAEQQFTVDS